MKYLRVAPLLFVMLFSACVAGHVPVNATPEMKIAIYGSDIMKGVKEVQKLAATAALADPRLIDPVAQVMIVAEKIGQGGKLLTHALSVYHSAMDLTAKKIALIEVFKILDKIDADIKDLLKPLDASGEKGKFIDVAAGIVKAVWAVRSSIGGV